MKVLFVEYCAKDILDGTIQMEPITELVYRRIIDMIYSTNDNLLDNDTLQYSTKAGSKWKKIKKELIEVHQKIYIEDGYIRNKKCTEKLAKSKKNIDQKSKAGEASASKRKSFKNNETPPTAVETAVPTSEPTNQEPNNQVNKKKKINKKEKFEVSEKFLKFWDVYPRHRRGNKENAWRAWVKALEEGRGTEDEILGGALSYARSNPGEYAKGAAAWLNDDRWTWQAADKAQRITAAREDWEPWKKSFAETIGEKSVFSWFSDADYRDGVLFVKTKFKENYIRQNFSDRLQSLGLREIRS